MSSWRANRVTSVARAVGGKLSVEGDRLIFRPHGFDRALAADDWEVPLRDVTVEVAPRRPFSHLFGAGLRRQLCIVAGGERTYFVVNRVEQVADELRRLAAA